MPMRFLISKLVGMTFFYGERPKREYKMSIEECASFEDAHARGVFYFGNNFEVIMLPYSP